MDDIQKIMPITMVKKNSLEIIKDMKRVYHKAKTFKDAEEWDILQQLRMTPEERQDAAKAFRERVYGRKTIDVRKSRYYTVRRPAKSN